MDIRFLIVGAPFILAFFYTLFWLIKWGAFGSKNEKRSKKMIIEDNQIDQNFLLENIFSMKD